MRFILLLLMMSFTIKGFAQNNFRIQVDTSIKIFDPYFPRFQSNIIGCSDGGVAMSGIKFASSGLLEAYSFVLRTDSNGQLLWIKEFVEGSTAYWETQIEAASNGHVYLNSEPYDPMFDQYIMATLQKIDINGNVIASKDFLTPPSGATEGHSLERINVEKNNDRLHCMGTHISYDWFNDEPCCPEAFSFRCDSNLNLIVKQSKDFLVYDSLDAPYYAYDLISSGNQNFGMGVCDLNGQQHSTYIYGFDTIQTTGIQTIDIIQDTSNIFMLKLVNNTNESRYAIHKVDKNWHTIYFTILDSINSIKLHANRSAQFIPDGSGGVYLSALYLPSSIFFNQFYNKYGFKPLMVQIDSTGSALNAWTSNDSIYRAAGVDDVHKSALFMRFNQPVQNASFEFMRNSFLSPTCGLIPATLSFQNVLISDSIAIDSAVFAPTFYPFPHPYTYPPVSISPPVLTTTCGLLGIGESDHNIECSTKAFPNPAANETELFSECEYLINSNLLLLDMTGKIVHMFKVKSKLETTIKLDCARIPSGIYIIKGQHTNQNYFYKKLVIQH